MINTRGQATCDAWSEAEFNHMYNPLIALVKSLDAANDQRPVSSFQSQCVGSLGDLNFEFLSNFGTEMAEEFSEDGGEDGTDDCEKSGFLRILPETCTTEKLLMNGDGCAFQVPIGGVLGMSDLSLQVAINTCPDTLVPFVSVHLSGAGSDKLFAPCSSDSQCGDEYSCQDPLRKLLIDSDGDWRTRWDQPPGGDTDHPDQRQLLEGKLLDELLKIVLLPGGLVDDISEFEVYSDEDVNLISQLMAQQDVSGTLATWLRSFWDDTEVTLFNRQVLPMCLPQGGDGTGGNGQFCWASTFGRCVYDDGMLSMNPNNQVDCAAIGSQGNPPGQMCEFAGCDFDEMTYDCNGDGGHSDVQLEDLCAARQVNEYDSWDQCEYDWSVDEWGHQRNDRSACRWTNTPGGVDISSCALIEQPWDSRSIQFGFNGDQYQCPNLGDSEEWAVDPDFSSDLETVQSKCLSEGLGSLGLEVFQVRRETGGQGRRRVQDGTGCEGVDPICVEADLAALMGGNFADATQGCQCCFMTADPEAGDPFFACLGPVLPPADFCVDPGNAVNNPDAALYECRHSCETGTWDDQNAAGCHGDNSGNRHEDQICVTEGVYEPGQMQPSGEACCSWCGDMDGDGSPDYQGCCEGMRADGEMGCEDTWCEWTCNGISCFEHGEDQPTCEANSGVWESNGSCEQIIGMQGMMAMQFAEQGLPESFGSTIWLGEYGDLCCTGYEPSLEGTCDNDVFVYVSLAHLPHPFLLLQCSLALRWPQLLCTEGLSVCAAVGPSDCLR